jgi:hypothetical protein
MQSPSGAPFLAWLRASEFVESRVSKRRVLKFISSEIPIGQDLYFKESIRPV